MLLSVGLTLAVLVGAAAGRDALQARVAERAGGPVRVSFDWPMLPAGAGETIPEGQPRTWLDERTRRGLESVTLAHIEDDPFAGKALADAQRALAETGWFARGPTLRRVSPSAVHVTGEWRLPFAVVRARETDRLVTYSGELLDKTYAPGASGLAVVFNPLRDPPTRPGIRWDGGDIQPALELIAYLRQQLPAEAFAQVEGVDVAQYARTSHRRLVIVTHGGGRVTWGGPVSEPQPGEEPSPAKVRHLSMLHQRTGRIDADRPNIDVRFKNVLIETPIVPEAPTSMPSGTPGSRVGTG